MIEEWLDVNQAEGSALLDIDPVSQYEAHHERRYSACADQYTIAQPVLSCLEHWAVTGIEIVECVRPIYTDVVHLIVGELPAVTISLQEIDHWGKFPVRVFVPERQSFSLSFQVLQGKTVLRIHWSRRSDILGLYKG